MAVFFVGLYLIAARTHWFCGVLCVIEGLASMSPGACN